MKTSVLDVKNLTASFRINKQWVHAIENVNFQVEQGKILGIVGESGCGKSVTSMSILRLFSPKIFRLDSGEINFKGKDIAGISDREMAKIRGKEISMIFQDSMTSLNPVMTIGRQLSESFRIHSTCGKAEAEKKSLELLKKVGMPSPESRMKEYPHQLSGGMRQRVMIAMALAQNPSLISADEPTTALDVTIQAQILDLLKKMKEESQAGIMLITHDMGVVANMADDIMVMYAGMVMEKGSVQDIFKSPKHPYTQGLLQAIPRKDQDVDRLYTIEGTVPTLKNMPDGCHFCTRCKYADERCRKEKPGMYQVDCTFVSCFKYEKEGV